MPLKDPRSIPKIPKTRKKKAHMALSAILQRRPDKLEYSCKAIFKYDNTLQKQFCAFVIETLVEFTAFAYELSADVIKEKNVFYFILTGLKTKMDAVPKV